MAHFGVFIGCLIGYRLIHIGDKPVTYIADKPFTFLYIFQFWRALYYIRFLKALMN